MTRKHFNDLANRLASMRNHPHAVYPVMPPQAWEIMVEEMANFCQSHTIGYRAMAAAYDEMLEYVAYKRALRQEARQEAKEAARNPATIPTEVN